MYDLLKGLRVVEGAAFIAGPSCGLHFAQLGAEVIRFDAIGGGPDYRRWPLAPDGSSLYWEGLNKGKKSIALDLSRPEGRELAVALATAPGEDGGLFLTNYPVKGFLSHAALKARREDIISLRVMGWADGAPAVDYTVNAATGIPMMTGPADDARPGEPCAARLGSAGRGLCRLCRRFRAAAPPRHGRGRGNPRAALRSGRLGAVASGAGGRSADRRRPPAHGQRPVRRLRARFPHHGWRKADRGGDHPAPVERAGKVLDLAAPVAALEAELGVDFARNEGARFTHRARLFPLFEAAFAARDSAALKPAFDAGGVTWGQYQSLHQAVTTDARLFTANPLFQPLTHPSGLTYPTSGPAATFANEARGACPRPAPWRTYRRGAGKRAGAGQRGDREIARRRAGGMSITATQIAHWRTWIGKTEIREEVLDAEALRRFAAALGESLVEADAPSLAHWAFFLPVAAAADIGPDGHPNAAVSAACQPAAPHVCRRAGIWRGAGAGLPATRTSTIRDVAHKAGRSGDLVLLEVEHRIEQAGALCVAERQTIVYRDAGAPTPAPVPASVPPQEGDVPWHHAGRSVPLFRCHLQQPPHPLRPALCHRRGRLSRPGGARPLHRLPPVWPRPPPPRRPARPFPASSARWRRCFAASPSCCGRRAC
jgi:2-methylfumaryl-CoA isomerase